MRLERSKEIMIKVMISLKEGAKLFNLDTSFIAKLPRVIPIGIKGNLSHCSA
jgi:hypothetical protein